MLTISEPQKKTPTFALWSLGFRPFFLAASVFAFAAMAIWLASLYWGVPVLLQGMPAVTWHAHEMTFAYSSAVISFFFF